MDNSLFAHQLQEEIREIAKAEIPSGTSGLPGEKGDTGDPGYTPVKGIDYFDGEPGGIGDKGPIGDKGETGDKGSNGDKGITGDTGADGQPGADGNKGLDGDKGLTGDKGATGDQGQQGYPGNQGADGNQGAVGDKGATGDPGYTFTALLALSGDISTGANTTPVNLTGLVFTFAINSKYIIELFGAVSAAAATTGCGFQVDVSAAVTSVWMTFFHQLANTGTLSGGNSIADDASQGVSSGIPAAAGVYPVYVSGILITGANTGTAQMRFRSETTAVITCKAGTLMRVTKVA